MRVNKKALSVAELTREHHHHRSANWRFERTRTRTAHRSKRRKRRSHTRIVSRMYVSESGRYVCVVEPVGPPSDRARFSCRSPDDREYAGLRNLPSSASSIEFGPRELWRVYRARVNGSSWADGTARGSRRRQKALATSPKWRPGASYSFAGPITPDSQSYSSSANTAYHL